MYVKTKERGGRTSYYLCIGGDGGGGGWKSIEYSVCLGERLSLSGEEWVETLRKSPHFRTIPLSRVLEALEEYAAEHGLRSEILAGLREAAARSRKQKSRRGAQSDRRAQEDERTAALRVLGLPPGSSDEQIASAFRKAARRCHPDVGGDPAKFRALVNARNLLLGRDAGLGEIG